MNKIKIRNIWSALLMVLFVGSILFASGSSKAANGDAIINEIAWMGTTDSANNEWIELYNPAATDVVLDDWSLSAADGTPNIALTGTITAGNFFLLERTSDETVAERPADQIYTGALGNSGELLELKDASGAVVDTANHSTGWTAGDNTTKQTMERLSAASSDWSTSVNVGGTPRSPNSSTDNTTPPQTPTPPNSSSAPYTPPQGPQVGDVVINELVADPADGRQEWIELYNRSDNTIYLNDWTITEGSGAVTNLSGSLGTHNSSRYAIFYVPKGNLNNHGDIVILKYQEEIMDQVTYGSWDDGKTADNALAAADPFSISRLPNGQDTNNDATDFSKTTPTPGQANRLAAAATDLNKNTTSPTITIGLTYQSISLDQIKQLAARIKVTTQGIVAAEPDLFGRSIFLASDSGLQLYLSSGSWPALKPGDQITVKGTVSQTQSYGTRLLIKQPADITIIEHGEAPAAKLLPLTELSVQQEGWLITTSGLITRTNRGAVTLLDQDKILKVALRKEIPWPDLTLNTKVTATGFLVINNSELKLWPRGQPDIVVEQSPASQVAGANDVLIPTTDSNWLGYSFIGLAFMIVVGGWWWEKTGRPKPAELWYKIWHK